MPGQPPADHVICPCFNVKQSRIIHCLDSGGARDLEDIRILSRAGAGCGGCEFEVEALVEAFYRKHESSGLSQRQRTLRRLLIANKRLIVWNKELLRRVRSTLKPRPSFFGAWWTEGKGLHTRIHLCNIASPAAPKRLWTERVTIEVFCDQGRLLGTDERTLGRSESVNLEVRDLLSDKHFSGHGLLRVKYHNRRALGSKRFYSHYYGEQGLTLVHEKLSGYRKGPGGYWTLSGVPSASNLDTHLIVSNGTTSPLSGTVTLSNLSGVQRVQPTDLIPPLGTRFIGLREMFSGMNSFLAGQPGTAQVSLRRGVMTCYVVHDRGADTWQIQHL